MEIDSEDSRPGPGCDKGQDQMVVKYVIKKQNQNNKTTNPYQ